VRVRWWLQATVVAGLAALLAGRWLAVSTADALWAEALDIAATERFFRYTRTLIVVIAFAVAAVWCIGNVLLVHRSIKSVHVPRRLGNLEIHEVVPRRLLLGLAVALGLALTIALTLGTGDWWQVRVLAQYEAELGVRDAVLGHDISYYLFRMPWQRVLHTFATLLGAVVAAVVVGLYAAVGAIRWRRRALHVSAMAGRHMAILSAVLALVLLWGYRLEPVEYVAGVHDVPMDTVLTAVRIPVARMLSVLALLVVIGSLLWAWTARVSLVVLPWLMLGGSSFAGHYLVPSFAAALRSTDELRIPDVEVRRRQFEQLAYGVHVEEHTPYRTEGEQTQQALDQSVPRPVLWDGFAVTVLLNRLAADEVHDAFTDASLGAYPDADGSGIVPLYLAARVVDVLAARDAGVEVSWESVHVGSLAMGRGAVAVHAHSIAEMGLPVFVTDPADPAAGTSDVERVRTLDDDTVLVAPGLVDFAVLGQGSARRGVDAGGLTRRLALAWALQSPALALSDRIPASGRVVWHRDVITRLERFAPFARFGRPRAVVARGRLQWVANGYVSADAFPLAPRVRWRNHTVRYLRSSLIGVVDAHSGSVSLYLTRDADPLSTAWARRAPELIKPAAQLPPALERNLPYPEEMLAAIVPLLQRVTFGSVLVRRPLVPPVADGAPLGHEAYWWVGTTAADTVARLRLLVPLEERESGMLAGLLDATVRDAAPVLELFRVDGADELMGPSQLVRQFARVRGELTGIEGPVRLLPTPHGVLGLQSLYVSGEEPGAAPRLEDIALSFAGAVGNGPTFREAAAALGLAGRPGGRVSPEWERARGWFRRMDAARRAGDWSAFGRAYEELRRLLVGTGDTTR
jgi:uncharacterized membrane protein (UPF0182 family)